MVATRGLTVLLLLHQDVNKEVPGCQEWISKELGWNLQTLKCKCTRCVREDVTDHPVATNERKYLERLGFRCIPRMIIPGVRKAEACSG